MSTPISFIVVVPLNSTAHNSIPPVNFLLLKEKNAEFSYEAVSSDPGINEWDVSLSTEDPLVLEVNVSKPGNWIATTDKVNGVIFSGSGMFSEIGNQSISLYGTGTPLAYGVHTYTVEGESPTGLTADFTTICASYLAPGDTEIVEVTGAAGRIWMDRNLGAHRVAETLNDCRAYGNSYQWGRLADGHQEIEWNSDSSARRVRGVTATGSASDSNQPATDRFIVPANANTYNWRNPKNDELWQNGLNDPCPDGFRLPTTEEWQAETTAAEITNGYDAFASSLKLTFTGYWGVYGYQQTNIRHAGDPAIDGENEGNYWSSTPAPDHGGRGGKNFWFTGNSISHGGPYRGYGFSVRCIKEPVFLDVSDR